MDGDVRYARQGVYMKTKVIILSGLLTLVAPAYAVDEGNAKLASSTAPRTQAMTDLDNEFLKQFAASRKEWLDSTRPVIVVIDGKAILYKDGKKEVVNFIPVEFDLVKTVDHSILAIFAILNRHTDKGLDDQAMSHLTDLKKAIVKAEADISTYSVPASLLDRQHMILNKGVAFIDGVLAKRYVSKADLMSFTRSMAPPLLANGDDAEAFELHKLDEQVVKWKNQMTPDEWNQLHVVVSDVHMAREKERYMQYFLFMLKEKGEGKRVIFAEGARDEDECMKLLGTHVIDELASEYFFKDPMRMHRDFLSDGATLFLQRHYKYFLVTPKSKAKR